MNSGLGCMAVYLYAEPMTFSVRHTMEKGRRTMAAPEAPAKGHKNTTHGRRPFRGAAPVLPFLFKSPRAQVGGFSGSSKTLARRLNVGPLSWARLGYVAPWSMQAPGPLPGEILRWCIQP